MPDGLSGFVRSTIPATARQYTNTIPDPKPTWPGRPIALAHCQPIASAASFNPTKTSRKIGPNLRDSRDVIAWPISWLMAHSPVNEKAPAPRPIANPVAENTATDWPLDLRR